MTRPRRRNPVAIALFLNAALLAAVLVVLIGRGNSRPWLPSPALGQVQQQIAGGAGMFMMPGQFSPNLWGVYLMDVDQQTLCAYTVSGSPPKLNLVAARSFRYDRELGNFNTGNPSPAEVKELLEKQAAGNRVTPPAPTNP